MGCYLRQSGGALIMIFRILIVAALIALGSPTLSNAESTPGGTRDVSPAINYTPVNLGTGKSSILEKMLRPKIKRVGYCDEDNEDGAICARRGCACGPGYEDFPCCNPCYIPPG